MTCLQGSLAGLRSDDWIVSRKLRVPKQGTKLMTTEPAARIFFGNAYDFADIRLHPCFLAPCLCGSLAAKLHDIVLSCCGQWNELICQELVATAVTVESTNSEYCLG